MKTTSRAILALPGAILAGWAVLGLRAGAQQAPPPQGDELFQTAQRNLEDASRNLDRYLQVYPRGKYATLAAVQRAGLQDLRPTSAPPVPVTLASWAQKVQWYVDRVRRTDSATRVTIKVVNLSPDQDCQFLSFNSVPLVIIGDDRELYSMSKAPLPLPKAVRTTHYNIAGGSTNDEFWVFQGGRTLSIDVEFERLPDGVAGGQIQYLKPVAGATPLKFSLLNDKQNPGHP